MRQGSIWLDPRCIFGHCRKMIARPAKVRSDSIVSYGSGFLLPDGLPQNFSRVCPTQYRLSARLIGICDPATECCRTECSCHRDKRLSVGLFGILTFSGSPRTSTGLAESTMAQGAQDVETKDMLRVRLLGGVSGAPADSSWS
jgi:hypothetical protein